MVIVVFLAVFAPMLIEAVRASRNERAQRARGGIEPEDDVYEVMRIAYPAAFLAMIVEGALRGAPRPAWIGAGFVLFVAAKLLKWWAILTLGDAWTFRVLVVPGAALVTRGPYRILRHPNYVGVVGELVGVALMTGAIVAGPLGIILFVALLLRRIAVEERAVGAILATPRHEWSPSPRRPDRG
jgi:methyltransferase